METLQIVLQNDHVLEYACVAVFAIVAFSSLTSYLRRRANNSKPDLDSDEEITLNKNDLEKSQVIFKRSKFLHVSDKAIDANTSDNLSGKVIPIKVNLFEGSDYKAKLRFIYGKEIVDMAELKIGENASAKELVEQVLSIHGNTALGLVDVKGKTPEFVEGSSRGGLDNGPEPIKVFTQARPFGLVAGLLPGSRRIRFIDRKAESVISSPSPTDSEAVTAPTGLMTPESRSSTPDSVRTVTNTFARINENLSNDTTFIQREWEEGLRERLPIPRTGKGMPDLLVPDTPRVLSLNQVDESNESNTTEGTPTTNNSVVTTNESVVETTVGLEVSNEVIDVNI